MFDYMAALQERFQIVSQRSIRAEREAEAAYDKLHAGLNTEQRLLLLRLRDAYTLHHDEVALDSFVSGYRLADALHKELSTILIFSAEKESEGAAQEGQSS